MYFYCCRAPRDSESAFGAAKPVALSGGSDLSGLLAGVAYLAPDGAGSRSRAAAFARTPGADRRSGGGGNLAEFGKLAA